MWQVHSSEKIRIKDIAEQAGVSAGTVDRILHGRPNVSAKTRAKVETVLKAIDYQPNIYASALAYNRHYTFCCLLPRHGRNAYWKQVENGLRCGIRNRSDFHLSLYTEYYDQFSGTSFTQAASELMQYQPQGMIVVPQDLDVTQSLCHTLNENDIPFVFLDSNVAEITPLAFFGQDALKSGHFAARILMMQAGSEAPGIMLVKLVSGGRVASRQQALREVGFREYLKCHHPQCAIHELVLPLNHEDEHPRLIQEFLKAHPHIRHCITFSSRAYILGDYFLQHGLKDYHLFGYDMIEPNVECLIKGSIDFIIAQHPWKQGYNCVKSLFNHIVLRREVPRYNYMPLELLTAENHMFYSSDEK